MQSVQPKYGYAMTLSACLWMGLFPLLQGGTYASLTHDKWIIMLILTGVTLLCFFFDLYNIQRKNRKTDTAGVSANPSGVVSCRPLIPAAVLLLWTVLSCLLSSYGPDTWWVGESARYEGLASQLCYFVIFSCFFLSRVSLKPVLLSAAAGLSVFFVIVMLQRSGGNPFSLYPPGRSYAQNPEFQGTIGNIDMDTGYLLLLSGFFLCCLLNPPFLSGISEMPFRSQLKTKPGSLFPAAVCLIGLCLSVCLILTMGVQFGLLSLAVLVLHTVLRFLSRKNRVLLLVVLVITVLLVAWFWPGQSGGFWEMHEVLHGRIRLSFGSNRIAVWYYSLRMARENLLFGGGSGTFRSRFNRFLEKNSLVIPHEQDGVALPSYFDNPHNEYIAQLTDHGLPAALLFLALLLTALLQRRNATRPAPCSAAVLCYAVQAFFSFSVCIVAPVFWVLLALSFSE